MDTPKTIINWKVLENRTYGTDYLDGGYDMSGTCQVCEKSIMFYVPNNGDVEQVRAGGCSHVILEGTHEQQ